MLRAHKLYLFFLIDAERMLLDCCDHTCEPVMSTSHGPTFGFDNILGCLNTGARIIVRYGDGYEIMNLFKACTLHLKNIGSYI